MTTSSGPAASNDGASNSPIDTPSVRVFGHHLEELQTGSGIDTAVIAERCYRSVGSEERELLAGVGFPAWALTDSAFWGLWLPGHDVRGGMFAGQWKPGRPAPHPKDGKPQKYVSARRQPVRLDVHPRWTRTDGAVLPAIKDLTRPLWVTEGIKTADALTSRGVVTLTLTGTFNWRNRQGVLADFEDVALKDRQVVVCFDSDARTKPQVNRAMARLGGVLKQRGARVLYCVVPALGAGKTGADDFLAAGHQVAELEAVCTANPPKLAASDAFTDARLAERLAEELLDGRLLWSPGLGWLRWSGQVWREVAEAEVLEEFRQWALANFADAAERLKSGAAEAAEVDGWHTVLSASRHRAIVGLARGIVLADIAALDGDPDVLNTPSGIVDLTSGQLWPHDPEALCTKITSGAYRPGFTHPDWATALQALPADEHPWLQTRIGQAITGHYTDQLVVLQGEGENGKGALFTEGLLPALGDYGLLASTKLLMSSKNEHTTERADLRGKRFVIAEELPEGRTLNVNALKQMVDTGSITARRMRQDNITFRASHTLFVTTNPLPVVSETGHSTWRRLAMVVFPIRYLKPHEELTDPARERRGDKTLKRRITANRDGQHDALVTWAVEGAVRWYASQRPDAGPLADAMMPPPRVQAATEAWRGVADQVVAFWDDGQVEPDPDGIVLAGELYELFTDWLKINGHVGMTRRLFEERFDKHDATTGRKVRRDRIRTAPVADRIVRRPAPFPMPGPEKLPERAPVYFGLRYGSETVTRRLGPYGG